MAQQRTWDTGAMTTVLGRAGLPVSRLGLGMAALGRPGYINLGHADDLPAERSVEAMERHAHDVLDEAYAGGIRYIDAARSYGHAENFLASWLERRGHADVVVGSKWGYTYTADWRVEAKQHEVKDHSLATLKRQVAESREVLGPRLRLLQIHSATLESGVLDDRAVLAELTRLAGDGLAIGLTLSGPAQAATLERALEVAAAGAAPFACVQATWNLLEPSVGPALARAHQAGWGVLVKEALANGRLTARGSGVAARLATVAARHGVGVDAVALAAVLARPFCDVVLTGAATRTQIRSNLVSLALELSSEDLEQLAVLAEEPSAYWTARSELPWT